MGRDDGFAELVRDRWPALVRAAVLLGCTVAEAEDLAQTALLRCYVAWNRVRAAGDRDSYVYRVLVNCHRDSRRRRWWGERPAEQVPDVTVDDGTGRVDDLDAVRRALDRLSDAHRTVVVLRFYAQLDERQIAGALRIPPGTVKSRLSRALERLSADLDLADLQGRSSS